MSIRNLDIDSTYRDRTLFPLSSDFDIPVYFGQGANSIANSSDPVSLSFPTITNQLYGLYPGLTTTPTLDSSLMPYTSIYNNFYLENDCNSFAGTHSYTRITAYNNYVATLASAITPTNNYNLRKDIPLLRDVLTVNATSPTTITLGALASNVSNFYVGMYLRIFTGLATNSYARITSYNGATKVANVSPALSGIPLAGDAYEICKFTKDNFSPLFYNGTTTMNQAVCYNIELINLILPNVEISNGNAGFMDDYPYFLVKLYNLNSKPLNPLMYTNNPNAKECLFKMPMHLYLKDENFFTLDKCKAVQQITMKPDDSLHFSVCLPNGEPIVYKYSDYFSPSEPNPFLQISASFVLKKDNANK